MTSLKETQLFFVHFSENLLSYLDDNTWVKKSNNFQTEKVQPKGVP